MKTISTVALLFSAAAAADVIENLSSASLTDDQKDAIDHVCAFSDAECTEESAVKCLYKGYDEVDFKLSDTSAELVKATPCTDNLVAVGRQAGDDETFALKINTTPSASTPFLPTECTKVTTTHGDSWVVSNGASPAAALVSYVSEASCKADSAPRADGTTVTRTQAIVARPLDEEGETEWININYSMSSLPSVADDAQAEALLDKTFKSGAAYIIFHEVTAGSPSVKEIRLYKKAPSATTWTFDPKDNVTPKTNCVSMIDPDSVMQTGYELKTMKFYFNGLVPITMFVDDGCQRNLNNAGIKAFQWIAAENSYSMSYDKPNGSSAISFSLEETAPRDIDAPACEEVVVDEEDLTDNEPLCVDKEDALVTIVPPVCVFVEGAVHEECSSEAKTVATPEAAAGVYYYVNLFDDNAQTASTLAALMGALVVASRM